MHPRERAIQRPDFSQPDPRDQDDHLEEGIGQAPADGEVADHPVEDHHLDGDEPEEDPAHGPTLPERRNGRSGDCRRHGGLSIPCGLNRPEASTRRVVR